VIKEWNKAEVYAKTIALFAERLDAGRTLKGASQSAPQNAPSLHDKRALR
jgi:hypothetical protein